MSGPVLDGFLCFVEDLRSAGLPVRTGAVLDATRAMSVVDIGRRGELRVALRSTLVKRPEDLAVFEALFEAHYPAPRRAAAAEGSLPASAPSSPAADRSPMPPWSGMEGLRRSLMAALATGDEASLSSMAREAADRYAGFGPGGRPRGGERYQLQRVLRALDLSMVAQQARRARRQATNGDADPMGAHLAGSEVEANVRVFRDALRQEILRRLPPDGRGPPPRPDEVDFSAATTTQLREMREAVAPLARRLASRLDSSRRRHQRQGSLDIRRTIHRARQTGGAPAEPAYRRRPRTRTQLWVLCDVSGSVAPFAGFLLGLVAALDRQLPRTRAFCFVDDVDEVTDVLAAAAHPLDAFVALARAADGAAPGRSDYGRALEAFWVRHGAEISPTATVLVCGDARSHHRDLKLHLLRALAGRARHVWLLNPEPVGRWDTGDSRASALGTCCDGAVEVRNLAQLTRFVQSIG